jgi:membrane fusion protein (multidrug efflux system)
LVELRPGMSVIPTIETRTQARGDAALAAAKIAKTSSGG